MLIYAGSSPSNISSFESTVGWTVGEGSQDKYASNQIKMIKANCKLAAVLPHINFNATHPPTCPTLYPCTVFILSICRTLRNAYFMLSISYPLARPSIVKMSFIFNATQQFEVFSVVLLPPHSPTPHFTSPFAYQNILNGQIAIYNFIQH